MAVSAIEALPVELLQPIFASSGYNLALVEASRTLGARLSSEYVYQKTCDYYLTGLCDDYAVRSAAQTAIFGSKWMTWSFFKSWVLRTYGRNGCLCGLEPCGGCFDAQWPPDFEDATSMVFSRSHLPRLAWLRCRLPRKLLSGPWTQDKVQFLRFLLWTTSMTVDWNNPEVCQLVLEGRRQAFTESNLEAVELFNHVRRLGRPPSLETVRFAVMEGRCDRSIVYDTLRTAYRWRSRDENWQCNELDEWCEQRILENDNRGWWLRNILEALKKRKADIRDVEHDSDTLFETLVEEVTKDQTGDCGDILVRNDLQWDKVSISHHYECLIRVQHAHCTGDTLPGSLLYDSEPPNNMS